MADVFWVGRQRIRRQVSTLTIGTADTGGTTTVTIGGTKSVVITPTTTNTTTTATELTAACNASEEGEYTELTIESATNVITFAGPEDGSPFTIAKADGGSNSTTLATPTTATSPNHASDGANYSTGSIPGSSDRLVLQDSAISLKHGLDGLTNAIAFLRKDTFTGSVGLPEVNANGYPEYRRTHLDLDATAITIEQSPNDTARQFRLECTSSSACTLTITGPGSGAVIGSEVVELFGTPASSVANVTGGSVAIAPEVGQVATVATLRGANSTIHCGAGTTLTTPTLATCQARFDCTYTTLTFDGGVIEVHGAAAGTTTTLDDGRLTWRSTGSPGTIEVGNGAYMDFTSAPANVAVSGTQKIHAGGTWDDRYGRVTTSYTLQLQRCDINEAAILLGNHKSLAVS